MKRRFTIYCHTNQLTGKSYIGQTAQTLESRWRQHVWDAQHNVAGCRVFARALRKYGADTFTHEVLDVVASQEGANIAERAWIKQRGTIVPDGYNLADGGRLFTTHPTTKRRIGDASRARYAAMTPEQRHEHGLKVNAARTPEERADIAKRRSAAWTPEQRSEMVRKAWANATPEQRAKRIENSRTGMLKKHGWVNISQEERADRIARANASRANTRANTPTEVLLAATEKRRSGVAAWRASMSPEQWHEHERRRVKKAQATRKSRKP